MLDRTLSSGALVSRRGFLGGLSALSVAAVAACSLPSGLLDDDLVGLGDGRQAPTPSRLAAGSSGYVPEAPFALAVSSELSQDFFLFQTHQVDPVKDTVVAYSRADGQVEAMLLQDGAIKQIYRDLDQPGGWGIYTFPDASSGVVDMVAGISAAPRSNGTVTPVLKVFYRTAAAADVVHVAVHGAGETPSFVTTKMPWGKNTGRLQISVNYDDSLLVSAIAESSSKDTADGWLDVWTDCPNTGYDEPIFGTLFGFAYNTKNVGKDLPAGWAATVARPWTGSAAAEVELVLPAGTYGPLKIGTFSLTAPSVHVWRWTINTNRPGAGTTTRMDSYLSNGKVPDPPTKSTTAYSVEYANALGSINAATVVVRTLDNAGGKTVQRLWALSPDLHFPTKWEWNELVLPDALAADTAAVVSGSVRPLPASEKASDPVTAAKRFLDVFVLASDMLHVFRQAPTGDANLDSTNPSYCPAIALHPGVAHMDSQAGVSSGDELLLVGTGGELQTLIKDPVSGIWSDRPVHLPTGDLEETSTYRLTLSVSDAWNMPVPDHALHVSASSNTTALVNGTAQVLGPEPTSLNTDVHGEVVLALIAEGVSAPTLTITGSDVPTATINPSDPVNTYLQGGSSLNYLPPLTPDSLAEARTPDGDVVAPGAKDAAAAKDAVTNMNLAAAQASSPNTLNVRHSATLKRRDGRLGGTSKAELRGILSDIDKWAHDALHAIKKGAAKIQKIGYDAATKVFTLAADFANWADNAVKIVVKGIEDAAHVIHAFLNKLGAEIVHAIKWLAAEVIGTFKDAAVLAHQFNDWITKGCQFLGKQARTDAARVDAWLAAKQATIKADLTSTADRFGSATLASLSTNPPQRLGGRPRSTGGSGDDDTQQSPHSDWFWQKVKKELFGALTLPPVSNLSDLMKRLLTAAGRALADFETAFVDFFTFLTRSIAHTKDADGLGIRLLLQAVAKLIDAVFVLARATISVLLDLLAEMADAIPGILTTPLGKAGGLVGALFKLIGLGNIPIGTVATTLYAFPTVLAYKIAHNGKGRPFDTAPHSRQGSGYRGDPKEDLAFAASAVLGTWAAFDTISAAESTAGSTLPLTAVIDIVSPILVGVLTVPAVKDGEPFLSPPVSGDEADTLDFLSWLIAMLPAGLVAAGEYLDHVGEHDPDLPNQQSMLTFAVTACGALSLGTGIQGLKMSEEASGWEYADIILNSIPIIVAAGVNKRMLEATEMISGVITGVLTLAAGLGGAVAHSKAS